MIRVLLVDDQATVRQGLKMRLELTKEIHVIGETGNGITAVTLAHELKPNVIVMDIELDGQDGISAARALRADMGSVAIVILSMHDDAETRALAQKAGATRFVGKHEGATALLQAIREVSCGGFAGEH